jgi:hypothetical protein
MTLLDYDTVIFDLDYTIWDGCRNSFWAKYLIPPYVLTKNKIYDVNGNFIELQDGIAEILSALFLENKFIGFASIGGLLDVEFENQPSIIFLNLYGIYKYFNYQKLLLYKTEKKASLLIPYKKTLYIDDSIDQLQDVHNIHQDSIDILNRHNFINWKDILYGKLPIECI